jgi:outer membrane receptor protein involved in Fe transport
VGEWRPSSHLRVSSNYTRQASEIVSSTSTDPLLGVGRELLRRPRHQGAITAEASVARGTLAATLVRVGKRADSDFKGIGIEENAGFTRVDIRAAYPLSPRVRVLAAVENAGDAKYQEVLGFKALPRRFRISLSWDSSK